MDGKREAIRKVKKLEKVLWGITLEPIVREEFTKRTSLEVDTIRLMLKHPKYEFMLVKVDVIVTDQEGKKCIFEAKTASDIRLISGRLMRFQKNTCFKYNIIWMY